METQTSSLAERCLFHAFTVVAPTHDNEIKLAIRVGEQLYDAIVDLRQRKDGASDSPIAGTGPSSPPGTPAGADVGNPDAGAIPSARRPRDPEAFGKAKARYERGDATAAIAADVGYSKVSVDSWAREGGWQRPAGWKPTRRPKQWPEARLNAFKAAWERGDEAHVVATAFDMQPGQAAAAGQALGQESNSIRRKAMEAKRAAPPVVPADDAPRPVEGEIIRPGEGPPRADTLTFAKPVNAAHPPVAIVKAPSAAEPQVRQPALVGGRRDVLAQLGSFRRADGAASSRPPAPVLPELEPKREHHLMAYTELVRALGEHGYKVVRIDGNMLQFKIGDFPTPYSVLGLRRVLSALDARAARAGG